MHKLIYEISEESKKGGRLTYFGLYLSRNTMKPGEKLNLMLAMKNYTNETITETANLFIQRSDLECIDWHYAAQKEITVEPNEGAHIYFSLEPEVFAVKKDFYYVVESGEYVLLAGNTPFSAQIQSDVIDVFGEEFVLDGKA